MTSGDSGREAYTAIAWGVGLSPERSDIAGAESFHSLEGNMCGTVMRGADALPGSKATNTKAQGLQSVPNNAMRPFRVLLVVITGTAKAVCLRYEKPETLSGTERDGTKFSANFRELAF